MLTNDAVLRAATATVATLEQAAGHYETFVTDAAVTAGLKVRCGCGVPSGLDDTDCEVCGQQLPQGAARPTMKLGPLQQAMEQAAAPDLLRQVLDAAEAGPENDATRGVARRIGLLRHCTCGHELTAAESLCECGLYVPLPTGR
jgi:hypothetical protein